MRQTDQPTLGAQRTTRRAQRLLDRFAVVPGTNNTALYAQSAALAATCQAGDAAGAARALGNLSALAEGYALCRALGVDDDGFVAALRNIGAWSAQADLRLPWMIAGDFENRFGVDLAVKDVRLALDAAARQGIAAQVGAAGLMNLVAASAHGFGGEDVDAVLRVVDPKTNGASGQ